MAWRDLFFAGLVGGGAALALVTPSSFAVEIVRSPWAIIAAGLLVGFGTRLGGGCTSGHGVCGVSRFAPRSIVATISFMASGAVTVYVVQHLMGGAV